MRKSKWLKVKAQIIIGILWLSINFAIISSSKSVLENDFGLMISVCTETAFEVKKRTLFYHENIYETWHNSEFTAKMAENKRRKNRLIMHFVVVLRGWNFMKSERKMGEKLKNRKKEREEEKREKLIDRLSLTAYHWFFFSFLVGGSRGVAGGSAPRTFLYSKF